MHTASRYYTCLIFCNREGAHKPERVSSPLWHVVSVGRCWKIFVFQTIVYWLSFVEIVLCFTNMAIKFVWIKFVWIKNENASENIVCEIVAIVSRERWVDRGRTTQAIDTHLLHFYMHSILTSANTRTHHFMDEMINKSCQFFHALHKILQTHVPSLMHQLLNTKSFYVLSTKSYLINCWFDNLSTINWVTFTDKLPHPSRLRCTMKSKIS